MYRVCVVVPAVEPHAIEHWLGALQPLITHGVGAAGVVGYNVGTGVETVGAGVVAGHVAAHAVVVINVDGPGHDPPQLAGVNTYCVDTSWPRPAPPQLAVHGLTTVNELNTQLIGPLAHSVVGHAAAGMHGAD